jgi:hypothetical protein
MSPAAAGSCGGACWLRVLALHLVRVAAPSQQPPAFHCVLESARWNAHICGSRGMTPPGSATPSLPTATVLLFEARPSEPARRWIWPRPRQRGRRPSRAAPASAGEGTLASRHPCHPTPADTGRVTSTPSVFGTAHPVLSRQLLRTFPCQRWHGGWSTTGLTRRRPAPAGEGAPVRRVPTRLLRGVGRGPRLSPPHQPGFSPAAPQQALQGPPRRRPG